MKRRFDGVTEVNSEINIGDIVPSSDAIYALGNSTKRFKNGYFSNQLTTNIIQPNSGANLNFEDDHNNIYLQIAFANGFSYFTKSMTLSGGQFRNYGTFSSQMAGSYSDTGAPYQANTSASKYFDYLGGGSTLLWSLMSANSGADLMWKDQVNSLSNVLYLQKGGFVGIGKVPSVLFDVNGTAQATTFQATNTTNQAVFGTTKTTTVNYAAPATSQTLTVPDSGHSTANFVLDGMGNATSVQQLTSLSTAVTNNARAGIITLVSTIPGNGHALFTLNNNFITSNSCVLAWSPGSISTAGIPVYANAGTISNGSCAINVTNQDTTNATSQSPVVYFLVI